MHGPDSPREVSTTPPSDFIKSESEPKLHAIRRERGESSLSSARRIADGMAKRHAISETIYAWRKWFGGFDRRRQTDIKSMI
jgi:hypothetical protein